MNAAASDGERAPASVPTASAPASSVLWPLLGLAMAGVRVLMRPRNTQPDVLAAPATEPPGSGEVRAAPKLDPAGASPDASRERRTAATVFVSLAALFGDGLRLAVVSAVLYFMGVMYHHAYADASGLPIDIFALTTPGVLVGTWEALTKGVIGLMYVGWLLLFVLTAAVITRARWPRRRRSLPRRVTSSHERDDLSTLAELVGYTVAVTTGVTMSAIIGFLAADRAGQRDGVAQIAQCKTGVRIVPVKDAAIELGPDARYCGKWGPDHFFVQGGSAPNTRVVVTVKESQVSAIVQPFRPKPAK